MAAHTQFDKANFQAALSSGIEEKVEVNQRHLIDKILARYSAQYTVFRELLQNSNDAGAKEVVLQFQSQNDNQSQSSKKIDTVIYKNNGRVFMEQDWKRLKSIAEGNPDETKVGFFGVGFYSLFSICEEPLVSSGDQCLGFFWRGDQLFSMKAVVPENVSAEERLWTTFYMDLREPMKLPDRDDFSKFIATSLSFTEFLCTVKVFYNDELVISLSKKSSPFRDMPIPAYIERSSPNNVLKLKAVEIRQVQMEAEVLPEENASKLSSFLGLASPKTSRKEKVSCTIFLRIARAVVDVKLGANFAASMQRTTKKPPPSTTVIQLIYTNYDEYDASEKMRTKYSVFNDIVPFPSQGRVFIGFPTHQTTGCSIHLAAHLIPTVERENIDFVDPILNQWNQEILSMGGLLARITYDDEMNAINRLYTEIIQPGRREGTTLSSPPSEEFLWLSKKAIHAMKSFTFRDSTPASLVNRIISSFFYKASKQPLALLSTHGVLPCPTVRVFDSDTEMFVKNVPAVPKKLLSDVPDFIKPLQQQGLIRDISKEDVFQELAGRNLPENEIVAALKWWIKGCKIGQYNESDLVSFKQRLKITSADETQPRKLEAMRYFPNYRVLPPDVPLSTDTLPMSISKQLIDLDLVQCLRLSELPLSAWSVFISEHPSFSGQNASPEFVQKIFGVLSRALPNLNHTERTYIVSAFTVKSCIPTTKGWRTPAESYFKSVNLFEDLSVVQFPNEKVVSPKLLAMLGVREHVDLQMIFDKLDTLNWDHVHLVKYLSTVSDKLTDSEIAKLKNAYILPIESNGSPQTISTDKSSNNSASAQVAPAVPGTTAHVPSKRFRAQDVFPPTELFRSLKLPILSWPRNKWRSNSPETKLLHRLGLPTHLTLQYIINQCSLATTASETRLSLLQYFSNNFEHYRCQYDPYRITVPFLPTQDGRLALPKDIFVEEEVKLLGFNVLLKDLKDKKELLGVRDHPSGKELVDTLRQKPPSLKEAVAVFSYLTGLQKEFSRTDFSVLRDLKFIPIVTKASEEKYHYSEPGRVYFSNNSNSSHLPPDLFEYIDFGLPANNFLRACGVKDEPSPIELAQLVLEDPRRFFEYGVDRYIAILNQLAAHWEVIRYSSGLVSKMKKTKWVIGLKVESQNKVKDVETLAEKGEAEKIDEGELAKEKTLANCELAIPGDVYLIDDPLLQSIFCPLSCPLEPTLEKMYEALGARWLSRMVTSKYKLHGTPMQTSQSKRLQALIHQRGPLLIYDNNSLNNNVKSNAQSTIDSLRCLQADGIEILREFNKSVHKQPISACVTEESSGRWGRKSGYLLIVTKGEVDFFDVARGLSDLLFKRPKLNDALLLSTMLSTSLDNLRRKGFPVDRILNIAPQLKKATPPASPSSQSPSLQRKLPELPSPPDNSKDGFQMSQELAAFKELKEMFPDVDSNFLRGLIQKEKDNPVMNVSNQLLDMKYPVESNREESPTKSELGQDSSLSKSNSNSTLAEKKPLLEKQESIPGGFSSGPSSGGGGFGGGLFGSLLNQVQRTVENAAKQAGIDIAPTQTTQPKSPIAGTGPSSSNAPQQRKISEIDPAFNRHLKSDLDSSIRSCRPNSTSSISSTPSVATLANTTYCDLTPGHDLRQITQIEAVSVWLDPAVSPAILDTYQLGLYSFIRMLKELAQVFGVQNDALNLYMDDKNETVAFNRGRTLYFNAGFYLKMHWEQSRGAFTPRTSDSYTYWFMVFAHELAHNHVAAHDSQHEFYMSSYASVYMVKLMKMLLEKGVELQI
ncbi:hypothetical protein BKA69DRAFT_1126967 [Paraphysoderma sedebokerense]|nr:hypothetical protein BKA69DRAFT_1126959 [Paraphysoderma sedebokerense]KAI9138947.1 hypothetical protein BKA69DRAFT_1126967 [Paraphysoderma sedebokerense]